MFLGGVVYLSTITIENFRCFGEGTKRLELSLSRGLTALVGENDSGKTAVIDALRFVLGTTDQEWNRLEDTDFHGDGAARDIKIVCTFEALSDRDKRAFVEYLTYSESGEGEPVLYVNWAAKDTGEVFRGRSYSRVEVHSGKDSNGPSMAPEARELLRATYLRPLRDAEYSLSAGRGQVSFRFCTKSIKFSYRKDNLKITALRLGFSNTNLNTVRQPLVKNPGLYWLFGFGID